MSVRWNVSVSDMSINDEVIRVERKWKNKIYSSSSSENDELFVTLFVI